jgi:hypothetical protein
MSPRPFLSLSLGHMKRTRVVSAAPADGNARSALTLRGKVGGTVRDRRDTPAGKRREAASGRARHAVWGVPPPVPPFPSSVPSPGHSRSHWLACAAPRFRAALPPFAAGSSRLLGFRLCERHLGASPKPRLTPQAGRLGRRSRANRRRTAPLAVFQIALLCGCCVCCDRPPRARGRDDTGYPPLCL